MQKEFLSNMYQEREIRGSHSHLETADAFLRPEIMWQKVKQDYQLLKPEFENKINIDTPEKIIKNELDCIQ